MVGKIFINHRREDGSLRAATVANGSPRVREDNGFARCRLIAPDDYVDVERIELDAAAHPPGVLGSHKGRPRAEEGVENNLATVR